MTEDDIPLDDDKTWDVFCKGDTLGIFQFASNVAIPVIKKMQPRNMKELAAANSLIRPGTSGLDEYVEAKFDNSKLKLFNDERIDRHLANTYSAIVFQEQIMFLISELMGISFGEADLYRRALEKPHKDKKGYVKNFNENVVKIATERGFDPKVADEVRQLIIENSGYAFNASHAVAYSLISYWTAWMKANYPLVFYTQMFNGNIEQLGEFMVEAKKRGITIKPPNIKYSKFETTIEDVNNNVIRIGLNAIKGIGPAAVESILSNNNYDTIDNFFKLNNLRSVNKKVIEALINSGCFNGCGIEIKDGDINSDIIDKFNIDNNILYLNREQLKIWYSRVNELNSKKTVNRYVVPKELLKQKYLDIYELSIEGDGTIVIPENCLHQFDLKVEDVEQYKNNRKKVNAFFAIEDNLKDIPVFRRSIIELQDQLANISENLMDIYVEEVETLGYSFIQHPLEKHMDKINILADKEDGERVVVAGILTNIEKRKTKTNKDFYTLSLLSPRELVRITMWDSTYNKCMNFIKKGNQLLIAGNKGFGGMTAQDVKLVKRVD